MRDRHAPRLEDGHPRPFVVVADVASADDADERGGQLLQFEVGVHGGPAQLGERRVGVATAQEHDHALRLLDDRAVDHRLLELASLLGEVDPALVVHAHGRRPPVDVPDADGASLPKPNALILTATGGDFQ